MNSRYAPADLEQRWQASWRRTVGCHSGANRRRRLLCPVDVSIPLGDAAHGSCAQLRDHRCDCPGAADARPTGAASDGMGCLRLPAENAAIERNVDPGDWTDRNIDQMRVSWIASGCPLTGTASRRLATAITTAGPNGCSSSCSMVVWLTGRTRRSTGIRWIRRCWPTNRWMPMDRSWRSGAWWSNAS